MATEGKKVSISQLCRWFCFPRSSFYYRPKPRKPRALDKNAVEEIRAVMEEFPLVGVPRLTVILNQRRETPINRKKVARIVRINNWQLNRRPKGHRPRVKSWSSRCEAPNQRWGVDQTHFLCGKDGWCHLTAVVDCFIRQIVGWRWSGSGKAKVPMGVLEEAILSQDLRRSHSLKLRSDNGLIFGTRAFVREVRKHGIEQELLTPYTPEQNGMMERFFRSLKEE